ncbi:hypothetical protein SMICM17S_07184 [Streptomyces microflavus]
MRFQNVSAAHRGARTGIGPPQGNGSCAPPGQPTGTVLSYRRTPYFQRCKHCCRQPGRPRGGDLRHAPVRFSAPDRPPRRSPGRAAPAPRPAPAPRTTPRGDHPHRADRSSGGPRLRAGAVHAPEPQAAHHHRRGHRGRHRHGEPVGDRRDAPPPPGGGGPRRPLLPQRGAPPPHGLPQAPAGQGGGARLAGRSARAPAGGAVRPVRGVLALPGLRGDRLGPPRPGRLGGGPVLAARLRRSRDRHRGRGRAGHHPPLDRRDSRHRAERRLLRPEGAADLAQRRPRLLAVPAADPGAALLAGVQRRHPDHPLPQPLLPLHERPGSWRLRHLLDRPALGRRPGQRDVALQPHRRRLPHGPRRQDPPVRGGLGRQSGQPSQRQHRPGVPRAGPVRAAQRFGHRHP